MENLIADLRYAARTLVKTPAFLLVSVLTLALGIGGNIAIFTLVQAVLLQPLPFPQPERLVRIFDNRAGARDVGMSVPEFEDLRQHSDIFEQISVIFPVPTALTGGERVERVEMLGTSPSYFDMLRAKPALGRAYTQADWVPGFVDGVVISDALWKRQFGGDPNVIGKRIRLDEDGYTIIGVMPPDFRHPGKGLSGDVEVWTAAGFVAAAVSGPADSRCSDLFPAQWDGSSPDCRSKKRNKDWMHSLGNYSRAIQTTILTSHAGSFELSLCNRVLPATCAQC